jgi:hypothetical protein
MGESLPFLYATDPGAGGAVNNRSDYGQHPETSPQDWQARSYIANLNRAVRHWRRAMTARPVTNNSLVRETKG